MTRILSIPLSQSARPGPPDPEYCGFRSMPYSDYPRGPTFDADPHHCAARACSGRRACRRNTHREPGHHRVDRNPLARSEEHTSELQSLMRITYAVFCLKKKTSPKTATLASTPMSKDK